MSGLREKNVSEEVEKSFQAKRNNELIKRINEKCHCENCDPDDVF